MTPKTACTFWTLTCSKATQKLGRNNVTRWKTSSSPTGATGRGADQVTMEAASLLNLDSMGLADYNEFPCATIESEDCRWIIVGDPKERRILGIRVEERNSQTALHAPAPRYAVARYMPGKRGEPVSVRCEGWFPNEVTGKPMFMPQREGPTGTLMEGRQPTVRQEVERIRHALFRNEPVTLCPETFEFAGGSPVGAVGVTVAQSTNLTELSRSPHKVNPKKVKRPEVP